MPSRFAAVAATTALGLALFGAAPAFADDLPLVGSEACTAAVAADEAVQSAQSTLNTSESFADGTAADLVDAQKAADAASAALNKLGADDPGFAAASALVTTTGTARDQAADAKTAADAAVLTARGDLVAAQARATGALCVDPPATTEPTTTPDTTTPAPTTYPTVEPTTTTPPVTETPVIVSVDPTADDGSVANTSGTQVTITPQGSAQTGTA